MTGGALTISGEEWRKLKRDLNELKAQVTRAARQERAEVAGSVPVVAAVGDLPSAGQLGRWSAVEADGLLYFDDGSSWKQVTLT
ncbi:hypothetical protein ACFLYO_00420 [Chloroflexota bacterium]